MKTNCIIININLKNRQMKRYWLLIMMMAMSAFMFADNIEKDFSTESLRKYLKENNIVSIDNDDIIVIKQYETSESIKDAAEKDEHICVVNIMEEYEDFAVANIEIKKDENEVLKENFSLIKKDGQWLVNSVVYSYKEPNK